MSDAVEFSAKCPGIAATLGVHHVVFVGTEHDRSPLTCLISVRRFHPGQIAELVPLKSAGPSEAQGDLEAGLLSETLNDPFKADRCNSFVWSLKVHEQNNLCPGDNRLPQRYSCPTNSNVVKHALHFCMVAWSIG
jgi:hypothetical protein